MGGETGLTWYVTLPIAKMDMRLGPPQICDEFPVQGIVHEASIKGPNVFGLRSMPQ